MSARAKAVHWIGGVRHSRGIRLSGWPCCCTGERCERLAADEQTCTRDPERVTCKACLRWMAKDDHAERWGLEPPQSALAAALACAEAAETGCEIAYRREPTQAEGDAHELPPLAGGDVPSECHVPMGNHHGHRCRCGTWVWGGPTVCQRCVDAEAIKIALEWRAEADRLRRLFDDAGQGEHNVLALVDHYQRCALDAAAKLARVRDLLERNGCDCACGCDCDGHDSDCERCLACLIAEAVTT